MNNAAGMNRILITGAAGYIGGVLRAGLADRYEWLRLTDIAPLGAAGPKEEVVQADIGDMAAMQDLMKGIDCVIHMAGIPDEDTWEKIWPRNLIGAYNVFEAPRREGVKRMIYASSNHVAGFYGIDVNIDTDVLPRPNTRYGVSKVYGEALGRLYADKHGMSVASLRIGSFRERPQSQRQLSTWISHGDMVRLATCCIEAQDYHYVVIYGVSNNTRNNWDNSKVAFLNYHPQDNAEDYAAEVLALDEEPDDIGARFHGGPNCSREFTGDLSRID